MKLRFLVTFFILFSIMGCNMFMNDEKLVGNIYLIKNSDDNKYHMVVYKGTINSNILEDFVINADGNDTLLLVKCENGNNDLVFYKVNHNKGENPIKATSISSQEYSKVQGSIKIKYHFYDNLK